MKLTAFTSASVILSTAAAAADPERTFPSKTACVPKSSAEVMLPSWESKIAALSWAFPRATSAEDTVPLFSNLTALSTTYKYSNTV